ncbi:MAG: ThuA domain-containing protein [Lachnospiraceae bacterium]|nr:ThuA domain-containing protein [Lachnospiraceae bacterium]
MIKITVWNEFKHEKEIEAIGRVYPEGIHGCIAGFLEKEQDFEVRTATFDMPEHGLTEEVLQDTDVLIIWSHALQKEFSDAVAERVKRHVLAGMGLIALHSAHYSKIMRNLMGTTMTLKWKHGEQENLWCIMPTHPIADGIPEKVFLPQEEMYGEYFDIPKPDDVIFAGWFPGGQVFRSGCTFTRGRGKIFYFQPGHEEYPIYYIPEIQQIIKNAVRFCVPMIGERKYPENQEVKE